MIDYVEKRDFLRMPIDCTMRFCVVGDDRDFQGKMINLLTRQLIWLPG